jgi:hypothetical protein
MEERDIDAVDDETVEQGEIDSLDVSSEEKVKLRAEARHRLDEAVDANPRPEHARE